MKQITNVAFSIVCTLLLLQANAQRGARGAQKEKKEYPFSKEDNISKSYPASGNSLSIDNQFGKVEIITWNSNEIKVDVHVKVSSTDKEMAEQTFDGIKVSDEKNGKDISFKTSMNEVKQNCNNCSNSMSIDYTVHLPADTKLNIKNSFGAITIPDYNGEVSIESKFGSISAQALPNMKNLHVEFGSATINSLENVDAVIKFSSVEIASISGNNTLKFEFCGGVKMGLTNSLSALNINGKYSTINIKPEQSLSASYIINTEYGSVVNRAGIDIQRTDKRESKYGPDSKKTFEGKSGSGTVPINIVSKFGKIIIGEPQPGDIKEKKQKEEKSSTGVGSETWNY
ncbi:MAG: hypothetical protein LBE82_05690 [Chitinophagaceae bacterium]|jgi:hypothetical protein|nr:hypothetical protein [Chitinophagaceae bacterium]